MRATLLAEIRLNLKLGTTSTSVKVNVSDSFTVPTCVTYALSPLGNLTEALILLVMVVNRLMEQVMCSEAPVSMIHLPELWNIHDYLKMIRHQVLE